MKKLRNLILFFAIAFFALSLAVNQSPSSEMKGALIDALVTLSPVSTSPPKPVAKLVSNPTPTPTPTSTPIAIPTPSPTPHPTASIGDRGNVVIQIQQRLADLGYLKGAVDGIYGNQTAVAVKAFQRAIGEDETGELDEQTSQSLFYRFAKAAIAPIVTKTPKPTQKPKQTVNFPDYRASASSGTKYVLNTSKKKFHKPSCRYVKKIAPKNYREYTGTRDEVIKMGYVACKVCYP